MRAAAAGFGHRGASGSGSRASGDAGLEWYDWCTEGGVARVTFGWYRGRYDTGVAAWSEGVGDRAGERKDVVDDVCVIPPNSFALASTIEYFKIPRNVLTICLGKSTYARCGIIVNVTPLEPEWEGHVTLEFSNTTSLPAKIYANEGVAQMLFLESDEECEVSYKDRGGKYQGQKGVTLPKA